MAGISKKKTGKGIKYVITYRDVFGKQHTSGLYDTKAQARKDLYKYERKRPKEKITLGKLFDKYIQECIRRNRAKRTVAYYNEIKKYYLEPYMTLQYQNFNRSDWQELLYEIRDKHSPNAADGCFRTLRAVINWAEYEELITENTFKKVKRIELADKEYNHFDIDEIIKLLNNCKLYFPDKYVMLFTFIGTGMREGEIFGLLKENINFEKNIIKVCTQYTNGEFKIETKTKKIRSIYMFPTLAQLLKKHIKKDETQSKLVFHNKNGGFFHHTNIRERFWKKLLELSGYPRNYARLHDLRGTNSDIAVAIGLPITFAQDQLGHASAITTLKNYNKTNNTMRKNGVMKLEEVFQKCENFVRTEGRTSQNNVLYFPKNASRE